jgi:hypothetical protein
VLRLCPNISEDRVDNLFRGADIYDMGKVFDKVFLILTLIFLMQVTFQHFSVMMSCENGVSLLSCCHS